MSDLDKRLIERIQPIYDKPQDEWGADEWREVATYAFAVLDEVAKERKSRVGGWESASGALRQLHALAQKYQGEIATLNAALSEALLLVKPPRKRSGRKPSKPNPEIVAILLTLADRHGTREAAKRLAKWQMAKQARSPTIYRKEYDSHVRTWENKVSKYRRMVADEVAKDHSEGLGLGAVSGRTPQAHLTPAAAMKGSCEPAASSSGAGASKRSR